MGKVLEYSITIQRGKQMSGRPNKTDPAYDKAHKGVKAGSATMVDTTAPTPKAKPKPAPKTKPKR
jgi:hypothetical protein